MKYIDNFNSVKVESKKREESYNRLGELVENSKEKVFARFTQIETNNEPEQKRYYVASFNNIPYDPYGTDSHRESHLRIKLSNVSKQTFEYYTLYLKTRNMVYMTRAQRSFING